MLNTWQEWVGTFTGVVFTTVLALPVAAVTVLVLALRRKARGSASPWRMSLADVGVVYWSVPWVWMLLLPGENPGVERGPLTLVPLADLTKILADGQGATGQILGNLAVFAALGFFAPMRFAALASAGRILALAAGCSFLIEVVQYLWLDRVSSVDDVLLNATGAWLAALASRRWWRDASTPAQLSLSGTAR